MLLLTLLRWNHDSDLPHPQCFASTADDDGSGEVREFFKMLLSEGAHIMIVMEDDKQEAAAMYSQQQMDCNSG